LSRQSIGEDMMLLRALLADQRLQRLTEEQLVAASSCTHEIKQEIGSGHQ
jgi:hypothetical protein